MHVLVDIRSHDTVWPSGTNTRIRVVYVTQ